MTSRLTAHVFATGLAVVVTLATMGGLNQLADAPAADSLLAAATTPATTLAATEAPAAMQRVVIVGKRAPRG